MFVSLIVLLIGVGIVRASKWLYGYWFNPVSSWFAPWALVVSLFTAHLANYEPLSDITLAAILLASGGYLTGCLMTLIVRPLPRPNSHELFNHKQETRGQTLGLLERRFRWLVALAAIGSVCLALLFVKTYGLAGVLSGAQRLARKTGEDEGLLSVVLLTVVYTLLPLSVVSGIRLSMRRRIDLWDLVIFIALIVFALISSGRAMMAFGLILVACGYGLARQRARWKFSGNLVMVLQGVVVVVLFGMIAQSRGSLDWFDYKIRHSRLFADSPLDGHTIPANAYVYATSSITNLNYYLETFDGIYTWGTSICYPITHQLAKMDLLHLRFYQGFRMPMADTPGGTNVYTFLRVCYLDYGLPGCFMIPFVLGAVFHILYRRFLQKGSIRVGVSLGYIVLTVVLSPYEYMLYSSANVFAFLFVAVIMGLPSSGKARPIKGGLPIDVIMPVQPYLNANSEVQIANKHR
jgi:oligosaccharide repeat unit polymerase